MILPEHINEIFEKADCLYSKHQVDSALDQMALKIEATLGASNPVLLCVMIGGLIPTGNLLPRLNFPLELDYIHATRYRGETSGKDLHWKVYPSISLVDRTVLIIDDILDGGLTLGAIVDYCKEQGAKEVLTAVMVDKEHVRQPGGIERADFTGLPVENRYVFGYGMDYKEYLRNAPGIFAVAAEHM